MIDTVRKNIIGKLPIGGFLKQSFIDYPGKIACVVFTQGCNFECSYCHNKELLSCTKGKGNMEDYGHVEAWIKENNCLLDAVVVSGGEPTLHKGLIDFLELVSNLNLKAKIFTNGTNPAMIAYLIKNKLIACLSMDVKAPLLLAKYRNVVGKKFSEKMLADIYKTLCLLNRLDFPYEIRTTLDNSLTYHDIKNMLGLTDVPHYLQAVSNMEAVDPNVNLNKIKKLANDSKRIYFVAN